MAPLTNAQISIDRWSKLLLIGCVLLIMVSGHAFFGCGQRHGHHHGPRGEFHGSHPDGQNSAAVSFAAGDSVHASASFSLSLSHGKPEQEQQLEQQSEQQGAASEGRGRGFRPNHRGGHFGARHGRRHHSHSHEQQKSEQQPEQQPEILPAVNAGTFDVKIQPARMADIKMPAAPRAVAIPLDLPAVDTVAEAGAADDSKPEPRPRHHHERRIMPRRAFRPDQQQSQQEQPQQLPVEQQPQQEQQLPQQKEGQMEQFPVIVDDLQQPMVDPIPPVFMKEGEQKNLPHPHPHPHHGFGGKKGRCCCAQRHLAGLGLATGATGVIAAFRPSRCGVALFLVGVLVVEVLMLLRVSNHVIKGMERCMDGARTVDEISACGEFGRRAGITATLIIGVIAASFASCGARLGRGVVAREQEERVEAEAGAISHAIIAGASVPIVVGSCDLAPLPAYVLAVEGTACVDAEEQQGGACTV